MSRSMQAFAGDDEAASTLRDLGYSVEEIGRTAGNPAVAHLGTEERLRTSLRALNDEHNRQVEARTANHVSTPFNPRVFKEEESKAPVDTEAAYRRGRQDERYLRKNDPDYKAPPKPPRARSPQALHRQQMHTVNKLNSLARRAKGKRR